MTNSLQDWQRLLNTMKVYPMDRTDETIIQEKFEEELHKVMHRAGEVDTD